VSGFNSAALVLRIINNTNLFSPVAKPIKVGGLHGGRAGRLVNSKGIMEVTIGLGLRKPQRRMSVDGSGQIYLTRGARVSGRATRCAQLVRVGRSPLDEKIRGRIQQEGARRGSGRMERVGRFGGKVRRPAVSDARDERQRALGRSRRTGGQEGTGFVSMRAR